MFQDLPIDKNHEFIDQEIKVDLDEIEQPNYQFKNEFPRCLNYYDPSEISKTFPHLSSVNQSSLLEQIHLGNKKIQYYTITSTTEDDFHKAIKYAIWTSTIQKNQRLSQSWRNLQQQSKNRGRLILFFKMKETKSFNGVAEMISDFNPNESFKYWFTPNCFFGSFKLKWHFIKDIPFQLVKNKLQILQKYNAIDYNTYQAQQDQYYPEEKIVYYQKDQNQDDDDISYYDQEEFNCDNKDSYQDQERNSQWRKKKLTYDQRNSHYTEGYKQKRFFKQNIIAANDCQKLDNNESEILLKLFEESSNDQSIFECFEILDRREDLFRYKRENHNLFKKEFQSKSNHYFNDPDQFYIDQYKDFPTKNNYNKQQFQHYPKLIQFNWGTKNIIDQIFFNEKDFLKNEQIHKEKKEEEQQLTKLIDEIFFPIV